MSSRWINQQHQKKKLGTHSAFKESLADIELRREQTIEYAEYFKNYELSLAKHQYDIEMNILQDEYEVIRIVINNLYTYSYSAFRVKNTVFMIWYYKRLMNEER